MIPRNYSRARVEQLARQVAQSGRAGDLVEQLAVLTAGLVRTATPIRAASGGPVAVLIASEYLTGEFAARARAASPPPTRITASSKFEALSSVSLRSS